MSSSILDIPKFLKVQRLVTEGATEGERAAAKARARAMAVSAGMTLKQAEKAAASVKSAPDPANFFAGFDDWMEEREPGYKAKRAQQAAIQEAQRKLDLQRIIRHYGSVDAVFDETTREASLREALMPIAEMKAYGIGEGEYVAGFAGWTVGAPTPELWDALRSAYPFPGTLAGVWREYTEWYQLGDDRCVVDRNYDNPKYVRARIDALEHLLDTMRDPTTQGIRTRLNWLAHVSHWEVTRNPKEDRALAATLSLDFAELEAEVVNLRAGRKAHAPRRADMARRTNADKRRDVMSMLDTEPGLTDREIARRCGVSPQSVGNWRRDMGARK